MRCRSSSTEISTIDAAVGSLNLSNVPSRISVGLVAYDCASLSLSRRLPRKGADHDYGTTSGAKTPAYGWHFSFDSSLGWVSSGFTHSPTASYIGSTHRPLAFIVQNLPQGLDDFGWMFAIGGLGVALTLGICMRIAGWGGFALNVLIRRNVPITASPVSPRPHCCW
jgi:hypothetical protein